MKPKNVSLIPRLIFGGSSSTAVILCVTVSFLQAADISWDDGAGDDLWSSVNNFSDNASPANDNITFGNIGSSPTAGTVTSIVDTNFTIGTLTFNNSPATNTHTLHINDGLTLKSMPGGTLNTLVVGGTTTNSAVVTSVIRGQTAGQGTLTLDNASGDMALGFSNTNTAVASTSTAILDLSALGSFSANLDELRIATSSSATAGNSVGQLTLANSNLITANTINVGGSSFAASTGSFLRLGASNTLNADLIVVGDSRTSATLEFRSGLTTPTVTIFGKGGAGTRADLIIADQGSTRGLANGGGGGSEITGVVNFQGGTVTASLDELVVGWGGASSNNDGAGDGTLSFDKGSIDALTVHIGRMANDVNSNVSTDDSVSDGTVNVSGTGTLLANSILMGLNDDTNAGHDQSTTGTLNVSGSATVTTTGDITLTQRTGNSPRAGAGTLAITGGTVTVGGNLLEGSTVSGAGANTSTVTLNGGTLDMTGGSISVDTFNAQSGKLKNVVQLANAAGTAVALSKTTGGTLILDGTNTYTGATNVSAGKLTIDTTGTINSTSGVSIGAAEFNYNSSTALSQNVTFSTTGGTLSGTGPITPTVNVTTGNTLAVGNNMIGSMSFGGALTVNGTFLYELDSGLNAADFADVAGNLTLGGILDLVQLGTYSAGDKFTLFAYDGTLSGTFQSIADDSEFTDAGGLWRMNYNDTSAGLNGGFGTSYVSITAVPEPAAALLGGLGMLLLLRRKRLQ